MSDEKPQSIAMPRKFVLFHLTHYELLSDRSRITILLTIVLFFTGGHAECSGKRTFFSRFPGTDFA